MEVPEEDRHSAGPAGEEQYLCPFLSIVADSLRLQAPLLLLTPSLKVQRPPNCTVIKRLPPIGDKGELIFPFYFLMFLILKTEFQASHRFRDPPASTAPVLGLKAQATLACLSVFPLNRG